MRQDTQIETLRTLLALHEQQRHQPMLGQVVQVPVSNYTDDAILQRELRTVFRDHPMLAGHVSAVRNPGDYILSDWQRFPFVVVRDRGGRLRAFLNVCRHRGARIVSGQEPCLNAFTCPFHGWTYGLDGKLRGITNAHSFPGLDREQFGLQELPVAERGGLVWVHPTPGATIDLDACLGPIGEDLDHFGLDGMVRFRKTQVVKKANWKLLIKTYLEGYHVPYLHRTTLSQSFVGGVIAHLEHGPHIRLAAARTNFREVQARDVADWRILDYASVYYTLFPQAFFIMHPDYVSINMFWPEAPDRTIWTHEMLYPPARFEGESGQRALDKRFTYTNDTVFDQEDFAVAEEVQAGLDSGPNRVHTLGLEEGLLAIFQRSIDAAMARGAAA